MSVKVVEVSHVAPPRGSVPPSTLPFAFFDLPFLAIPVTSDRVFLFHAPRCTTSVFLRSHLPDLRRSLSLALQRFYPLAGRLIRDGANPHVRYSDGDSVAFTVVESHDDLQELTSDGPRDAERFYRLVPNLPSSEDQPVVAVQATIFPERGLAIGISVHHAVMDDSSCNHFIRTWASICKQGSAAVVNESPPLFDRTVIPDPRRLYDAFLSDGVPREFLNIPSKADVVRATFRITAAQLDDLRRRVQLRSRPSSFALAVALAWTCLVKVRGRPPRETECVAFPVDCRPRYDPAVPASYFGNCVGGCLASVAGGKLVEEGGFAEAVSVLSEAIRELEEGGAERAVVELEKMVVDVAEFVSKGAFSVTASPRYGVYGVDFGWGRPAKVEVVSIHPDGQMSLLENGIDGGGGGGGGLEIGLLLTPPVMDEFTTAFDQALNTYSTEAN